MAYVFYNPNPSWNLVGDCTVRAISKLMCKDWDDTYIALAMQGFTMKDMPSANHVWGAYLKSKGYRRYIIPDTCPDCYTAEDFCLDHPQGTFVLGFGGHVATVKDGVLYDSWDSSNEIPIYYWSRKEDD